MSEVKPATQGSDEGRAESRRMKDLIEALADAVVVIDNHGEVAYANPAAADLFGRRRNELVGQPFGLPAAVGVPTDVQIIRPGGAICFAEMRVVESEWEGKSVLIACLRDISERKRAEDSLQRSEALHKEAQRVAHIGHWEMDLKIGSIVWSDEIFRIFGLAPDPDEPSLNTVQTRIHPEDWPGIERVFRRTATDGGDFDVVFRILKLSGEMGWMHAIGTTALDQAGKVVKLFGTAQDITVQKLAEEALRLSEERLQAIFKAAPNVSFVIADAKGSVPTVLEFSPGAESLFDYRRAEIVGQPLSLLQFPEEVRLFPAALRQMHEQKQGFHGKTTLVRKSGETFPAYFSTYPLFDRNAEMYAALAVSIDISQQESLQAQLIQAQKLESVGRLAGGVAHDFNNMISVIIGYAEMAMQQLGKEHQVYADLIEIMTAARRSADITRQLLAFARKQTIAPRDLDLNETVQDMLKMLWRLIGEDIDLVWRPAESLWAVMLDPSQVDQILANLVVNARDAITGVGKITIETGNVSFNEAYCKAHAGFSPGDFVLLAVSDNGCGMPRETVSVIFEPFFTTKEEGRGTGLGLATVYGIVKQNNGFINVYSEPGQGTTVKIYLPCYLSETEPALPAGKASRTPKSRGETILVVEDDPTLLKLTRRMLERLGYIVLAADNHGAATALVQQYSEKIHLLIADVIMPEMNGRDLAEKLLTVHPEMKVLFMSGYTANVIAHHGVLEAGVHFIQKPFSMEDLSDQVREVLGDG